MKTNSVQDGGVVKGTPSKMRWITVAVAIALLAAATLLAAMLVKKSPLFLGSCNDDGQTKAAATATATVTVTDEQPENYTTVIATNESTVITFPPYNKSEAHGCDVNKKTPEIAACPVVGDSYAANLTFFDTGGFAGQDCFSFELLLIMQGEEDMWPWTAKDVVEWCGIPGRRAL